MKSHKSEVAITFIYTNQETLEHRPQQQTNNLPLQGHWGEKGTLLAQRTSFNTLDNNNDNNMLYSSLQEI